MFGVEIKDKVAWVTGGSRGIGRATALALGQAGCDVAVGYRTKAAEAETVAAEIRAFGRRALAVEVDVADFAACERTQAAIESQLGKIDILVNNAGVTADNLFVMLEDEDWQRVLNTNVMGVVHATKVCVKDLMLKRWGRVINLSSVAASKGGRGQANYAASKGAVESMTRSLAVELAKRNITVNCVAPGVIETDMSAEVRSLGGSEIMDRQLVKRYGKPEEVAAWVVFLASDYGAFVTGEIIHVDGGMKMP